MFELIFRSVPSYSSRSGVSTEDYFFGLVDTAMNNGGVNFNLDNCLISAVGILRLLKGRIPKSVSRFVLGDLRCLVDALNSYHGFTEENGFSVTESAEANYTGVVVRLGIPKDTSLWYDSRLMEDVVFTLYDDSVYEGYNNETGSYGYVGFLVDVFLMLFWERCEGYVNIPMFYAFMQGVLSKLDTGHIHSFDEGVNPMVIFTHVDSTSTGDSFGTAGIRDYITESVKEEDGVLVVYRSYHDLGGNVRKFTFNFPLLKR